MEAHTRVHSTLLQSCPTLCDPVDRSPPGSSVHGIVQARILEWLPCPPPGQLPNPGNESLRSACISRWLLDHWHHLGRPARLHRLFRALHNLVLFLPSSHSSFQVSDPLTVLTICESQNTPQFDSHWFLPAVSLAPSPLRCSLCISQGHGRLVPS